MRPNNRPEEPAKDSSSHRTQITVAIIGLIGVLLAALVPIMAGWLRDSRDEAPPALKLAGAGNTSVEGNASVATGIVPTASQTTGSRAASPGTAIVPPADITGEWQDRDGRIFKIQQIGQAIDFKVYRGGKQVGQDRGSIFEGVIHQTYWGEDGRAECPSKLENGNHLISGACHFADGLRDFQLKRVP